MFPNRFLTAELFRGTLWNTLVPFARHHFRDNCCYQDDNATSHHAWVVLDFFQQGNVTMMEQPPRSPVHTHRIHLGWIGPWYHHQYGNPPQNLGEVPQALLSRWAEIPVERLQGLVASMSWCLATIIISDNDTEDYTTILKECIRAQVIQSNIESQILSASSLFVGWGRERIIWSEELLWV